MKKRSVKQKAIERAKDSGIYRDGFNHGYEMGYKQRMIDERKGDTNDNQLDKVDRQDDSETTWADQIISGTV